MGAAFGDADSNVGCDALDQVEALNGPRETGLYHYSMEADHVDHGEVRISLDASTLVAITNSGSYKTIDRDVHGLRAAFEGPGPYFSSGLEFRVDYEYDQHPLDLEVAANGISGTQEPMVVWVDGLDGDELNIEVLSTDLPAESFDQRSAVMTPADLEANAGDLAKAIATLLLSDDALAQEGVYLSISCTDAPANAPPEQTQTWSSLADVGYFEKPAPIVAGERPVRIFLDLTY